MKQQILIREMRRQDASAVAELSGELGYSAMTGEMGKRFEHLAGSPEHAVFVACSDDAVVGWIDVAIVHHLASEPFGEIGGLVVSDAHRGQGTGHLLVKHAEKWIAGCGVRKVVVRSRTTRERAHRFYLKNDYLEWKRQVVFSKEI